MSPYIVLGMHKSGTTLVAKTLQRAGVKMVEVEDNSSYDAGNKYEHQSVVDLNARILRRCTVPFVPTVVSEILNLPALGDRRGESLAVPWRRAEAKSDELNNMREIQNHMELTGTWGFKDPRTSLTYHLWARVLPQSRVIVVWRDYEDVIRRYTGQSSLPRPAVHLRAMANWIAYNRGALDAACQAEAAIVLKYADLMEGDEAIERLRTWLGFDIPDVREGRYYRNSGGEQGRGFGIPSPLDRKARDLRRKLWEATPVGRE